MNGEIDPFRARRKSGVTPTKGWLHGQGGVYEAVAYIYPTPQPRPRHVFKLPAYSGEIIMLYPLTDSNRNATVSQRIMVPKAGRKFIFTKVPGSYCDTHDPYTCTGYPNTADRWSSHDIYITSVVRGSGTFHRLLAWEHAEWEYVE